MTSKTRLHRSVWLDIEGNIFPAARPAVQPWDDFPFHSGAVEPHSSQALAISVFGTLMTVAQHERDRVCGAIAGRLGLPEEGTWSCGIEWMDNDRLLREPRRTQVDAVLRSEEALVLVECKLAESPGSCSQTSPLKRKGTPGGPGRASSGADTQDQCSGNYEDQKHPVSSVQARCALTGKGVRYWDHIPDVLGVDDKADHRPCPFAGAKYQLMRNAVTARAVADANGLRAGFLLAYGEGAGLHAAEMVQAATGDWPAFLAMAGAGGTVAVGALAYQELAQLAATVTAEPAVWTDLGYWVDSKVAAAIARGRPRS